VAAAAGESEGHYFTAERIRSGSILISKRQWNGSAWLGTLGDVLCWLLLRIDDDGVQVVSENDGSISVCFSMPRIPAELLQ
jgi:hypothetical protein